MNKKAVIIIISLLLIGWICVKNPDIIQLLLAGLVVAGIFKHVLK